MPMPNAIIGHAVRGLARRTTDLVNLLSRDDADAAAVDAVLRAHGETDPLDVSSADVAAMRAAALRLRAVFTAPDTGAAADSLNTLLARSAHPPRLTSHGGTTHWHVHVDGHDDAPLGEWFLTSACLTLSLVLTDRQRPPGGVCAAAGCERVFVDTGSGSPRRYCSQRCATRSRVAAHRRSRA
ncbi:CGNR zinc finger domain-containing protein [Nocardiopsis sediminis]|uniref:CGNR zinc finger domain-containing protein n=1 Tax=Nocardiopsis sediminis TaxID=1778267 RepID=A0ABV8FWI3_9ACTN